jgi:hypothetical protein
MTVGGRFGSSALDDAARMTRGSWQFGRSSIWLAHCDIPGGRLLIAKIDIEGAEREACAASVELLRTVPCIMIEPHDYLIPGAGCLGPIYRAVADRALDTLIHGENLILIESRLSSLAG